MHCACATPIVVGFRPSLFAVDLSVPHARVTDGLARAGRGCGFIHRQLFFFFRRGASRSVSSVTHPPLLIASFTPWRAGRTNVAFPPWPFEASCWAAASIHDCNPHIDNMPSPQPHWSRVATRRGVEIHPVSLISILLLLLSLKGFSPLLRLRVLRTRGIIIIIVSAPLPRSSPGAWDGDHPITLPST